MKNTSKILCLMAIAFLSISTLKAQVKIGKNPTVITSTSALEIEALKGKKVVITKDSGRVGINTTAPRELLDVFGKIRAGGWGKGSVSIGPGLYDGRLLNFAAITFNPYLGPVAPGQFNNDSLDILTNSPHSFIADNGNSLNYYTMPFGVWHHSFTGGPVTMSLLNIIPEARLHVQGYLTDSLDIIKAETKDDGSSGFNPRNLVLGNVESGNSRFAVIAFTPNPSNKKSGAEIYGVERSVAKLGAGLAFSTKDTLAGAVLTERMRISAKGRVGINTTAPRELLDVFGTIRAGGWGKGSVSIGPGPYANVSNGTSNGASIIFNPYVIPAPGQFNNDSLSILNNTPHSFIADQGSYLQYNTEPFGFSHHGFTGGSVSMGLFNLEPTARLNVQGYSGTSNDSSDVIKAEINACGDCGQDISRNIVLGNVKSANPRFAVIAFTPNPSNSQSGAEINGVERSVAKLSAGLAFSTRENVAGAALTERMRISANGNVGIGLTNSGNPLQMFSGAFVSTMGVWTNASDARLKTNIVATTYGLKEVMALRPVHYNMKRGGEAQVGFIAQEVRKVIPEVVSGIEGDILKGETLGLSYGNLVPVLTKAIQEQQAQIEALKAEKVAYKALMKEMRAEIKSEMQAEITSLREQFGIKAEENQKAKK